MCLQTSSAYESPQMDAAAPSIWGLLVSQQLLPPQDSLPAVKLNLSTCDYTQSEVSSTQFPLHRIVATSPGVLTSSNNPMCVGDSLGSPTSAEWTLTGYP